MDFTAFAFACHRHLSATVSSACTTAPQRQFVPATTTLPRIVSPDGFWARCRPGFCCNLYPPITRMVLHAAACRATFWFLFPLPATGWVLTATAPVAATCGSRFLPFVTLFLARVSPRLHMGLVGRRTYAPTTYLLLVSFSSTFCSPVSCSLLHAGFCHHQRLACRLLYRFCLYCTGSLTPSHFLRATCFTCGSIPPVLRFLCFTTVPYHHLRAVLPCLPLLQQKQFFCLFYLLCVVLCSVCYCTFYHRRSWTGGRFLPLLPACLPATHAATTTAFGWFLPLAFCCAVSLVLLLPVAFTAIMGQRIPPVPPAPLRTPRQPFVEHLYTFYLPIRTILAGFVPRTPAAAVTEHATSH